MEQRIGTVATKVCVGVNGCEWMHVCLFVPTSIKKTGTDLFEVELFQQQRKKSLYIHKSFFAASPRNMKSPFKSKHWYWFTCCRRQNAENSIVSKNFSTKFCCWFFLPISLVKKNCLKKMFSVLARWSPDQQCEYNKEPHKHTWHWFVQNLHIRTDLSCVDTLQWVGKIARKNSTNEPSIKPSDLCKSLVFSSPLPCREVVVFVLAPVSWKPLELYPLWLSRSHSLHFSRILILYHS